MDIVNAEQYCSVEALKFFVVMELDAIKLSRIPSRPFHVILECQRKPKELSMNQSSLEAFA